MRQMSGLMKAAGDKVHSFAYRRKGLAQEPFSPYFSSNIQNSV